jgi:predicted amidohydrolase YtcJ
MNHGATARWRAGAMVTTLAAIAVLATACGGTSSPVLAGQTAYQKALAYSQCMRAHGIPGFPDPQPNGSILLGATPGQPTGTLMNSANKACQHLLPKTHPMTAAQLRQATNQALKFVACMRAHGITDMQDPVVNSQGIGFRIGGPGSANGPRPNSPVFQSAQHACQKLMPGGPP